MVANKPPTTPSSNGSPQRYTVGFGQPPKASQFKRGQSGNPKGRPKGQPTVEKLLLKEAARLVKVKIGDTVVQVPKLEALVRRLFDAGLQGDIQAARLALWWVERAQTTMEDAPKPQEPLSAAEIELLKFITKEGHAS